MKSDMLTNWRQLFFFQIFEEHSYLTMCFKYLKKKTKQTKQNFCLKFVNLSVKCYAIISTITRSMCYLRMSHNTLGRRQYLIPSTQLIKLCNLIKGPGCWSSRDLFSDFSKWYIGRRFMCH